VVTEGTRKLARLAGALSLLVLNWLGPLAVADASSTAPGQATPNFDRFDAYVEQAMRTWRVPGIAIAIVRRDRVLHLRGYGVHEMGAGGVDPDTVFAIGSNGKSFTAVMLASLADGGTVDLRSPIVNYLPRFRMVDPYATQTVTFEDALSHRSGLAEQSGLAVWYMFGAGEGELVASVARMPPARPCRSGFAYNNTMFAVAGAAASAATGSSYENLVRARVLQPLRMTRSSPALDITTGDNVATPHTFVKGVPSPVPYHPVRGAAAAGSMNSTARDMASYVRMMMNGGSLDGAQVLRPQTAAQLQQLRHVLVDDEMKEMRELIDLLEDPGNVTNLGYALGLASMTYNGSTYTMHGGGIDGMTSWMAWSVEDDIGFVALTNGGSIAVPAALMFKAVRQLRGLADEDILARVEPLRDALTAGPALPEVAVRLPEIVPSAALAGTYANGLGAFHIKAIEGGARIRLDRTGYEGAVHHLSGGLYAVLWDNPALPVWGFQLVQAQDGSLSGLRGIAFDGVPWFDIDPVFEREG
jgi:CubicO group peptidase (beta-lactamase class C family)